jgi:hypothetical protein
MKSKKREKERGEIITRRQHGRVLYHQANRRSAISSCVKHDRKSRDISSGKSFENGELASVNRYAHQESIQRDEEERHKIELEAN